VPLEQGTESLAIAGACGGDETGIWIAAELPHRPNLLGYRFRGNDEFGRLQGAQ
jgi:hypothetical protein